MSRNSFDWDKIDILLKNTLEEDFGSLGDITTDSTIPRNQLGEGKFVAKADGIIAGLPISERIFQCVDPHIQCLYGVKDGDEVKKGDVFGSVKGSIASILKGERTALNFMQRMSGIATMTNQFVKAVSGTRAKILDTRKTMPQLRALEKYAVRMGGGENHRFGLFDMVLIKDNHVDAAGSITEAVNRCVKYLERQGIEVAIEVECRSLKEVHEAMGLPIHRIMLDNMTLKEMNQAVLDIDGKMETEASGNVSLNRVKSIAETGVDFISIGALTHSVQAFDISLRIH